MEQAVVATGRSFRGYACDFADRSALREFIKEVKANHPVIDILVNNASTTVGGTLETLTDDQLLERLQGKTLAYMRCSRAMLPWLRKAGGGRVICIGGAAARAAGGPWAGVVAAARRKASMRAGCALFGTANTFA